MSRLFYLTKFINSVVYTTIAPLNKYIMKKKIYINTIVAVSTNGVIGNKGALPSWKLKRDLQNFKKLTTGYPVIMGRKTFESLGRPLPNRINIVVTENKNFKANDVVVATSPLHAIALTPLETTEVFFIGGENIFKEALKISNRLYITYVDEEFEGDAFFKEEIDLKKWKKVAEELWEADHENSHNARFVIYEKI